MGYPYHELIPAAILLDNPGLTKEEFAKLLESTHYSEFTQFHENDPWDSYSNPILSEDFSLRYKGPYYLASVLTLPFRNEFLDFKKETMDEHNLTVYPPFLSLDGTRVRVHERNVLGDEEVVEDEISVETDQTIPGERGLWYFRGIEGCRGVVTRILGETYEVLPWGDEARCRFKIRFIHPKYREEAFSSIDELVKEWPQFTPEFMYDFSQENGSFTVDLQKSTFLWRQKDGRFYLDEETFNRIPIGFTMTRPSRFGYIDLILTAEAIKNRAWKLLSYRGLKNLSSFLRDFPESRERYEKAIRVGYNSLYAKRKEMTVSQFLRLNLGQL